MAILKNETGGEAGGGGAGGPALYPRALGVALCFAFACSVGFGATLAEPALGTLGLTVERLTGGEFTRRALVVSVAWVSESWPWMDWPDLSCLRWSWP
jgi:hypothetical protein